MNQLFGTFDFALLDDADFREDSVREELIVPLIAGLGYSASPPHRIIRSKPLKHPYVYIGTRKHPVTIIPDYLLQRDEQNAWILDAKAPSEAIDSGKHVEQAYSYAIHPDVRVPFYALCNGRRLVLFHVSRWPSVLDFPLREIAACWPMLLDIVGSRAAWPHGIRPGFHPDFGLAVMKSGLAHVKGTKTFQVFVSVPLHTIAKVQDDLYCINALYGESGQEFMVTFDFGLQQYEKFLSELPADAASRVRTALRQQPFQLCVPSDQPILIGVVAEIGDTIHTNEDESYCPFIASDFIGNPNDA